MSIFVGLDCGGSSSRIMAVDQHGTTLYQGQSGAANLLSTPEIRLRRNLMHAAKGCPSPDFVCGCFAGLVSDQVREKGLTLLLEIFPNARLRAEPDYTAAFYASPPGTDICVISGTGSLVCSRQDRLMVKSGGRGYILGDEGSSYQFGRDALVHYLNNPDGCSPQLRAEIGEKFGTNDPGQIVPAVYQSATPAGFLGKLAHALGQDAQAGEAYAERSLNRNLGQLADQVADHVQRHLPDNTDRLTVSLAGGLWKASPVFKQSFSRLLQERISVASLAVERILKPPLHGAIELAREMALAS